MLVISNRTQIWITPTVAALNNASGDVGMRAAPGEAYESDERLESGKLTGTHYPEIRTDCPFDDALKTLSKFK